MRGRFRQHTGPEIVAERFAFSRRRINTCGACRHYNVAPWQVVLTAMLDAEGEQEFID